MCSSLRPASPLTLARLLPAPWRGFLLLWLLGALASLGLAQTEHLIGDYAGSYSGGDAGRWSFTVEENLSIYGGVSSYSGERFSGSGKVSRSGGVTIGFVNSGASFKGTIAKNGKISGTWNNPEYGISGTFSGARKNAFISTASPLPSAIVGAAYKRQFSANGGSAPYVWTLVDGELPDGLTLSSGGLLSGASTAAGMSEFTVEVTNKGGSSAIKTFRLESTLPVPAIKWRASKPIAYGTALSATQLNATCAAPGELVYTPAPGTLLPAGKHTLHVAFTPADPTRHAPSEKTLALVVRRARQTITLDALPATLLVGDPDHTLAAASTSGLPVSITSSRPAVATMDGPSLHLVGAGKTILTLAQPGDANWLPAPTLKRTVTVLRRPQTIDFPALAALALDEPDFAPAATATSDLPVIYASSAPKVAAIVNGRIHLVGVGSATITATQPGDSTWAPAPPVRRTLLVNPVTLDVAAYAGLSGSRIYRLTEPGVADTGYWSTDVLGAATENGLPVYSIQEYDESGHENDQDYLLADFGNGLLQIGGLNDYGKSTETKWFWKAPYRTLLPRTFVPGKAYPFKLTQTRLFPPQTITLTGTFAVTRETITVPYATLQTWKVVYNVIVPKEGKLRQIHWYAPGLGLVKREQEDGTLWELSTYEP